MLSRLQAGDDGDDEDDEENEVQPYQYIKYLQLVEKNKVSLEKLFMAKQGVLLTVQSLRELGATCWAGQGQETDGAAKMEVRG